MIHRCLTKNKVNLGSQDAAFRIKMKKMSDGNRQLILELNIKKRNMVMFVLLNYRSICVCIVFFKEEQDNFEPVIHEKTFMGSPWGYECL